MISTFQFFGSVVQPDIDGVVGTLGLGPAFGAGPKAGKMTGGDSKAQAMISQCGHMGFAPEAEPCALAIFFGSMVSFLFLLDQWVVEDTKTPNSPSATPGNLIRSSL
jgi:hypothetical protein